MSIVLKCPKCQSENNHVKEVVLYLGNDFYDFTDALKVEAVKDELVVTKIPLPKEKSKYRLRGEVQTIVRLKCEEWECDTVWENVTSHHKGVVYVDQKLTDIESNE